MKKDRGFTLIELMVTLAVAAILLTVGVPSMRDLIRNNRLAGATNTFVSSLNVVRSEAVKQGRNATLCVSSDTANAAPTCTGETNWRLGWVAWVDSDADGALDSPGEILRIVEPLPTTLTVTLSTAVNNLRIDSQGNVSSPNITLDLCDDRTAETGRRLRVLATGGVSLNSQFACS